MAKLIGLTIIAVLAVLVVVMVPRCNKDFESDTNKETFKTSLTAAEQGDKDKQYHLGGMYYGGVGVEQDIKEAFKWFRKAAEQGLATAQYNTASIYESGAGVVIDLNEAFHWYLKAAEQEMVAAQLKVGMMYNKGDGVEQDDTAAYMWLGLSAATGEKSAVENLDIITKRMTTAQLARGRQLVGEWKAKHKK